MSLIDPRLIEEMRQETEKAMREGGRLPAEWVTALLNERDEVFALILENTAACPLCFTPKIEGPLHSCWCKIGQFLGTTLPEPPSGGLFK